MPCFRAKQVFLLKAKEGKEQKRNKNTNTKKESLGPSDVSPWATSPDP